MCGSAAVEVDHLAEALGTASRQVDDEVSSLGELVWSGQGAQAFRTSVAEVGQRAEGVVAGWQRLSEALEGYARALGSMQVDADAVRSRLRVAEDDLEDYQVQHRRAKKDWLAGDASASGRVTVLQELIGDAQRTIANQWVSLDDIGAARALLDERSAAEILAAPGAGAQAWASAVYRANGSQQPLSSVIDDLVTRLDRPGELSGADYDMVAQFLAMYSGDPEAMAAFFDGLGAAGLAGFMNSFVTGGGRCGWPQSEVLATDLCAALAAGLATASRTWDAGKQVQFGRDLVDATDANLSGDLAAEVIGVQAVAYLLGAAGLAPQVALGALQRVEEIRVQDPGRYEVLSHDADGRGSGAGVFSHQSVSLAGAIFGQLARIPDQALDFFVTRPDSVTEYWFGQHDWTANQFAGPAGLLDAIVNSPSAQAAHAGDPLGESWTATVGFASRAFEALGGNLSLRAGALSTDAARNIAAALGAFAPETATGLTIAPVITADGQQFVKVVGPDGKEVQVPALTTGLGNLSRLLGIATLDPQALAVYGSQVGAYAIRVRDYLTGPEHPPYAEAKTLLGQVGALYGFTYASYALESSLHAEEISDRARRDLDAVLTLASLVPVASTGRAALDFLVEVSLVGAEKGVEKGAESLVSGIVSDKTLDAIIDTGLNRGKDTLSSFADSLSAGWGAINPPYTTDDGALATPEGFISQLNLDYDNAGTSSSNDVGTGRWDVTVPGEDTPRNRGDM